MLPAMVEDVGIIGLGAMGLPMARNLVAAGHRLGLTGRSPAKAASLVEAGAVWHENPRSLAADAGVVVLMLPDLPEVEAVLDGPDGILAASPCDLILVISSTSSPDGCARCTGDWPARPTAPSGWSTLRCRAGPTAPRPARCRS
jgi:2-hydroxy-3-oxopropionate reductase